MKLKKLFAGIVAVAMMATMAIPGFAAGGTVTKNSTVDATDKTVNITVKYEGSGFGSDKIKLALDATDAGKPYAIKNSSIKNVTDVADKTISVSTSDTNVTEAASGTATEATLTVTLPDYTNVGTYFYKLKQVEGATAGMTYDTDQLYLMVNVVNEKEDLSTDKLEYKVALFKADPKNLTGDALKNAKIDCLTNKYTNGQFTVKKEVKGNMADRNETFNFRVTFENTTTDKDTIPAMKVDGKDFGTEGIKTLTWADNKASYDFTLKHGVTVAFSNIPAGMKITVTERNSDNTADVAHNTSNGEYTATYDDVAKTGVTISKEVTSGAAVITNTSNVHPNTGVILDNAPYIALLTIVAAGAVVMIMKKRRNYED